MLICGMLAMAAARGAQRPALLRPADVVALVGGEDMAAAADCGYIEYFLIKAAPAHQLRFRSLAKEGDTVFERARDFNYPTLEMQLTEIGATVVLVQVGQMESMRGDAAVGEFEKAVEKLVISLAAGGARRVILVGPTPMPAASPAAARFRAIESYAEAVRRVAHRTELPFLAPGERGALATEDYRDGLHLNERGHLKFAEQLAEALSGVKASGQALRNEDHRLLQAIRSKNELWFHYVRPQNWAFLNGDRTIQPASRDHRDPEKRWFPEEMKSWVPLIAEREREIWRLARPLETK